jgi:prepilin-type N-terminal cleavage/methylation domain-containing protein
METLQFSNHSRARGFSLLEVVVAIGVLTIGLTAMAGLVAQSLSGTERARNMALATTLASEKLEDLNRWPNTDHHVYAGGSITTDATGGNAGDLDYYDDVDLSSTSGQLSETVPTTTGGHQTIIHQSNGIVIPNSTSAAPTGVGTVAFHRRWLIEANPVVNGVTLTGSRRVTVLVSLSNTTNETQVSFQMSALRP